MTALAALMSSCNLARRNCNYDVVGSAAGFCGRQISGSDAMADPQSSTASAVVDSDVRGTQERNHDKENKESRADRTFMGIRLRQDGRRCTGGWLWASAPALCCYLDALKENWREKMVLELGSGTGFNSMFLAMRGATVVATDQAAAMSILRYNVCDNVCCSYCPLIG